MADKVDPRTGELTTTNYGWVKPTVGASVDAWGGYINTDLDGIDSTVKAVSNAIPAASSTTPAMDGTAAVGTGTTFARADHIHPTDTSRYAASNPNGYQTAAQVTASLAPYALLASPVFTGTPSLPTGATGVTQTAGTSNTMLATTAFVGALPVAMNDNRLINGDMRIDQRNNGASGTATGYTADRWKYAATVAGKGMWQRIATSGAAGFQYALGFTSSSAYTPASSDYFYFSQTLEADAIGDFNWGQVNAQPATLSFWALSSLTGTFSGAIGNAAYNRTYPFTFSLPSANTWTKFAITVPADTAGAWVLFGNAASLTLSFDLGGGATNRGPPNAWASAGYVGATGAVSVVATNGATFYLTGVKLEIGSTATPYNRQSLAKSMADCQRYYQFLPQVLVFNSYATAGTVTQTPFSIPWMRASPTVGLTGATSIVNCSAQAAAAYSPSLIYLAQNVTAAGYSQWLTTVSLSAEL